MTVDNGETLNNLRQTNHNLRAQSNAWETRAQNFERMFHEKTAKLDTAVAECASLRLQLEEALRISRLKPGAPVEIKFGSMWSRPGKVVTPPLVEMQIPEYGLTRQQLSDLNITWRLGKQSTESQPTLPRQHARSR